MIPLVVHYIRAFLFDENSAKRFLAGLGGLVGSGIVTVLAFGVPTVLAWTPKELAQHGIVALAGGLASMLPAPSLARPAAKPEVQP